MGADNLRGGCSVHGPFDVCGHTSESCPDLVKQGEKSVEGVSEGAIGCLEDEINLIRAKLSKGFLINRSRQLAFFEPSKFDDKPADIEDFNRKDATFIYNGLVAFFDSDEVQQAEKEIKDAKLRREQDRIAQEKKDAQEAGDVMQRLLSLLESSGVSGNIANKNPEVAKLLLTKLFDLHIDEHTTIEGVSSRLGSVFPDLPSSEF